MARHHRVWVHALISVRVLFAVVLAGLILIDVLAQYVKLQPTSVILVAVSVVVPSLVSVWLAHSENPELHYLPSVVILVVGLIIGATLALGCDMNWFVELCFGGMAGPAVVLAVMLSWAGVTFAFGLGAYRKMLRHGKIK